MTSLCESFSSSKAWFQTLASSIAVVGSVKRRESVVSRSVSPSPQSMSRGSSLTRFLSR